MTTKPPPTAVRRAARVLALTPALLVTGVTGTAFADVPEQWESAPHTSFLHVLLILGAIPAGLFLLIALLVYVPSMSKGTSYQPGLAWRGEPIWFGGPRGGVQALEEESATAGDHADQAALRGGSSGRW